MLTLEEEYKNDPGLLDFYKIKLLDPGWAGELEDNEADYISRCLFSRPCLERRMAQSITGGRLHWSETEETGAGAN